MKTYSIRVLEPEIGDKFILEYDGELLGPLVVVEGHGCRSYVCDSKPRLCSFFVCGTAARKDGKDVQFAFVGVAENVES